jgi:hypothetical protein
MESREPIGELEKKDNIDRRHQNLGRLGLTTAIT